MAVVWKVNACRGVGECLAGWKLCWTLEIDGRWFKNKKLLLGKIAERKVVNYVQGRMEEIWGEDSDRGVLHIAAGWGGDCGTEVAGGREIGFEQCIFR